jgi:hypothetical protein
VKKLLIPLLLWSINSTAAEFHLGDFPGTANFGNTVQPGSFSDNYNFTVNGANLGGEAQVSITRLSAARFTDLRAEITNVVTLAPESLTQLNGVWSTQLANGNYVLNVAGTLATSAASYSGTIEIPENVAGVPLPPALYMFGVGLMGLFGVRRHG